MYNFKFNKQDMKSLRLIFTISITWLTLAQTNNTNQHNITQFKTNLTFSQRYPNVTLDQQIDEKQLQDVQSQNDKQELLQFSPWIALELKNSKTLRDFNKAQSFLIHLHPDQSYEYQWDLNDPRSKKRTYQLLLNVYTHQGGEDIAFVHDPEQDSFINVQIRSSLNDPYTSKGKVYMTRTFTVNFQQQEHAKMLRFTNHNSIPILLQINMEVQIIHLQLIKETLAVDKHFQMSAQKLNAVFQQAQQTDKSRTQSYKWEWGFLDREERYQDEMLKLTGVQLFVILVTAIVQMYCLKGLLENKQIV